MSNPDQAAIRLLELSTSFWKSQALFVATKLKVADHLSEGPLRIEELATRLSVDEDSLYRLLRALETLDIFCEVSRKEFGLTTVGQLLASTHPDSPWSVINYVASTEFMNSWNHLLYSVQTGKSAFQHIYGQTVWDYGKANNAFLEMYNQCLAKMTELSHSTLYQEYDFSKFHTVVDIGGGNGSLLASLLENYPNLHGILFDAPWVLNQKLRAEWDSSKLNQRIKLVGGNFFELESIPADCDAYILKSIIHDWDDHQAETILSNIAQAMADNGTLFLIERVFIEGQIDQVKACMDLAMLVVHDGKERSIDEYGSLVERSGLVLKQIIRTPSEMSIIECVKNENTTQSLANKR